MASGSSWNILTAVSKRKAQILALHWGALSVLVTAGRTQMKTSVA
jgi:hypothetical protein